MYAVIRTGGKQYRVSQGDVVEIERLTGEPGETLAFDEVLLLGDDGSTQLGRPIVAGAVVKGEIVDQFRGRKIIVFKMRRRKTYRKKQGHRQEMTRVRITAVEASGQAAAPPPVPSVP